MSLREFYKQEVVPQLKDKFGYKNDLEVPHISKVIINVGFGQRSKDKEFVDNLEESLKQITGQKPVFTKAKKSVSSFKIREGMIIGAKVTLRGKRMYDFLEKLIKVSLPRTRDFRGISSKAVDSSGNLTIGLKDNLAFPEIEAQDLDKLHGLEVSVHTATFNREEGWELFKLLGFPFEETK